MYTMWKYMESIGTSWFSIFPWTFPKMWMGQNLLLPSISISNGNQLRWASYLFQGIIFWGCWFWPSKSEANPNQIWSNFPILQDQSPDLVAPPMAAHHAAALDRVWWLERCAATPGRWTGEKWPPMLIYIYIYLSIYISIYIYIVADRNLEWPLGNRRGSIKVLDLLAGALGKTRNTVYTEQNGQKQNLEWGASKKRTFAGLMLDGQ